MGTTSGCVGPAATPVATFSPPPRHCLIVESNVDVFDLNGAPLALEAAAKQVVEAPEDATRWIEHGRAAILCDYISDAERAFKLAIRADSMNTQAYLHLAGLYLHSGNYEAAAGVYVDGLQLSPNESTLWAGLANCHAELGRNNEALAEFRRAIAGTAEEVGPHPARRFSGEEELVQRFPPLTAGTPAMAEQQGRWSEAFVGHRCEATTARLSVDEPPAGGSSPCAWGRAAGVESGK